MQKILINLVLAMLLMQPLNGMEELQATEQIISTFYADLLPKKVEEVIKKYLSENFENLNVELKQTIVEEIINW